MRPCKCGKPVRLGAYKVRINRKHGVAHYIAHAGESAGLTGWECIAFKPYPKDKGQSEYQKLLNRWEAT